MPYTKTTWANSPATTSPLSAANLNNLETQYDEAMADSVSIVGDTMTGNLLIRNGAAASGIELGKVASSETPFIDFHSSGNNNDYDVRIIASGGSATVAQGTLNVDALVFTKQNFTIWHAGNDGSTSGLDADLLDGLHGTSYVAKTGDTMTGDLTVYRSGAPTTGVVFLNQAQSRYLYYNGTYYELAGAALVINGGTAWHSGNDGSGSTLDADTVDGIHGTSFVRASEGNYTGNGNTSRSLTGSDGIPTGTTFHLMIISEVSGTRWYIHRNNHGSGFIPGAGPSSDEIFDAQSYFQWSPSGGTVTIGVGNAGFGANNNGSTYHWTLFWS